jgi:two-component system OmpR family response regulator
LPIEIQTVTPRFRPNVLIAEPEGELRDTLADLVASAGAEPLSAPDGQSALRLARQVRLHAGVFDVDLPDLPGLRLFRMLREMSALPALFVGRTESKEIRMQLAESGVWSFLPLPLERTVMQVTIQVFATRFLERDEEAENH